MRLGDSIGTVEKQGHAVSCDHRLLNHPAPNYRLPPAQGLPERPYCGSEMFFEPRLEILPESQWRLWPELDAIPSDFVLYGGTGLALQLGHRVSEDFDFFSSSNFDPDRLRSRLPFFRNLDPADSDTWVQR